MIFKVRKKTLVYERYDKTDEEKFEYLYRQKRFFKHIDRLNYSFHKTTYCENILELDIAIKSQPSLDCL